VAQRIKFVALVTRGELGTLCWLCWRNIMGAGTESRQFEHTLYAHLKGKGDAIERPLLFDTRWRACKIFLARERSRFSIKMQRWPQWLWWMQTWEMAREKECLAGVRHRDQHFEMNHRMLFSKAVLYEVSSSPLPLSEFFFSPCAEVYHDIEFII
jgi:hypothetical protein